MITQIRTDAAGMEWGATFSDCGKYRTRLWRTWAPGPKALLVAMNSSKASHLINDPTVARWMIRVSGYVAGLQRYGGCEIANAFSFIEPDSRELVKRYRAGEDIIGPGNDEAIYAAALACDFVVVAWGQPGKLGNRDIAVLDIINSAGRVAHSFKVNADGTPQHPLYLPYTLMPSLYSSTQRRNAANG